MKIEYILAIQNNALAEVLSQSPTLEYFYRRTCRQYSQKFNTPLPQVYKLPFDEILRDMTESRYEDILYSEDGEEELIEIAEKVVDPTLESKEEQENEEFLRKVMEEENLNKARQMAKELNLNPSQQPQSSSVEAPPPMLAGNSMAFDDEIPPEAFESDDAGLDDL